MSAWFKPTKELAPHWQSTGIRIPSCHGTLELRAGEVLLLATDGLEGGTATIDPSQVPALFRGSAPIEEHVQLLLERADDPERGGGRDNLGVVALRVD